MDLLERDGALATLAAARDAAALGGGRVVCVSGEPGIGKTALVRRFLGELEGERVLVGTCDDLSIPRPLGPFRDLAAGLPPDFEEALRSGAPAHELQALLVAELDRGPRPSVVVLEDVHWADDATLDSITVLGRRIGSLPALLVLTFRGGEAPPAHPLRAALGAIPASDIETIELEPLSREAVMALAGEHAEALYAATGGNPFYLSELLAARGGAEAPPASVANAVLGRLGRLDGDARRLVELVSVVPNRVGTAALDSVIPGWAAAAEEPERRQLLEVEPAHVRFRHELARGVVRSSLPAASRRGLHAEILAALLSLDADPADVVHHAEAAGEEDVVAEHALVAARRAAALDSNREAWSHYRRAADFFHRLEPAERAEALEDLTMAAYLVGRLDDAFAAIERAITIHEELGDRAAVGRCTRVLSRIHWFAGDGEPAREKAREAVAILEPLGESQELARALSGVSQLAMLAEDGSEAVEWGERALALATRLGDERTRAHALVNIGCVSLQQDHRQTGPLLEAYAMADAAGEREDGTRALGNLGYVLMTWARPAEAVRYAHLALAYAQRHEVHAYVSYVNTWLAWLRMRAGEWDEAERITHGEVERGITVVQLLAKTVLTELAVRRGDRDAAARLADLTAHAERAGELQRVVPVVELMAERALTGEGRMPIERFEQLAEVIGRSGSLAGRFSVRLAGWAAVAGVAIEIDAPGDGPYAAMRRGEWRESADGFGELGWRHDRALMLSLTDEEPSLAEALETARELGAEPLARRVTERMRELGLRVPQGPRQVTRANPAGLTARQLQVLELIIDGLTNAEIAERLIVSPRTAEHHVAAVLRKLDAPTRRDVAARASELGL